MDNDDPMMAGEADLARVDELGLDPGSDTEAEEEALPDTLEIELDGEVYEIPAALKGAFLRQADYTRKTQDLAEQRRAVEAERRALAEHRRAADRALSDHAYLAALDDQLESFSGVDWQGLAHEDPQRAEALWSSYQEMEALRGRYAQALAHRESQRELEAAREAAERMAETGRTLQQEIDGWSPDTAAKLVAYAQAFGVTLEELAETADARLWKLLHKAWRADQADQQANAAGVQGLRPAVTVTGAASAGGIRDELATRDWMARRSAQVLGGR
jgi:hypothetical protein